MMLIIACNSNLGNALEGRIQPIMKDSRNSTIAGPDQRVVLVFMDNAARKLGSECDGSS
jgi:hypothetical protein